MKNNITHSTVTSTDGLKIYADASGNTSKPALIFLHGFRLAGAVFDSIFANEDFAKNFHLVNSVVACSLCGYLIIYYRILDRFDMIFAARAGPTSLRAPKDIRRICTPTTLPLSATRST